jgi:hypothetical protein
LLPLHPKIQAALFAALATVLVSVAAAVADVYPDAPWVPIMTALVPVIAGYLRSGPQSPLVEKRTARLLDPKDDLADLSYAETRAVEQRGHDLRVSVREGIYRARSASEAKKPR